MESAAVQELIDIHHSSKTGFSRHYMMLYSIILGMECEHVFEFGSGYSSKAMLLALEETGGKLTSCDYRPIHESCMHYFKDTDEFRRLSARWNYLHKRSSRLGDDVKNEVFDVVLHDGSHTWQQVVEDLKLIIPRVKRGGIVLLHDTRHPTDDYQLERAINVVENTFLSQNVTLPYGYGLTIITVIEDFGHGEVEIKWRKGL